jgi:hypothetical protein
VRFYAHFHPDIYTTSYRVSFYDPGANFTYTWSKGPNPQGEERVCGVFAVDPFDPSKASWKHPDAAANGDCPDEAVHPASITVVFTDGYWTCTVVYRFGSDDDGQTDGIFCPHRVIAYGPARRYEDASSIAERLRSLADVRSMKTSVPCFR